MENQHTGEQTPRRKGRGKLINRFLKGSKALFLLCMVCAAVSSLAEMIVPQIIRVTIDNVIGGEPMDSLARPVQDLMNALGGPAVLKQSMWISIMIWRSRPSSPKTEQISRRWWKKLLPG